MTFTTALATPPLTAKPRPSPVASTGSGPSATSANWMALASNMPITSSKVSTKSTSLRMVRRLASSFLAAQGPMNTTLQPGWRFLIRRAVSTMGVRAMLI